MLTMIGTGSGSASCLTAEAMEKIRQAASVILKTERMPVAAYLNEQGIAFSTLDALFGKAGDFDELNALTADAVLSAPSPCCYLVQGDGCEDTSVALLRTRDESATLLPGVSVASRAAAFLGVNPGFVPVNASFFSPAMLCPSVDFLLTGLDTRLLASEAKGFLSRIYGDEYQVSFYIEAYDGTPEKAVFPLFELDRQSRFNHTACVFLPARKEEHAEGACTMDDLQHIMERLISPDGCPWDSVQTHSSLRPYLIEEAYEVADAIDRDDTDALYDELGDVLLQVMFHACIGARAGEFDLLDITDSISRKMIRRHPFLFGGTSRQGNLNDRWEEIKRQEKHLSSITESMDDVPQSLPALLYAQKLQHKASKARADKTPEEALQDFLSAADLSSMTEESLGNMLFSAVELCRVNGINPELALRKAAGSYRDSFSKWEKEHNFIKK